MKRKTILAVALVAISLVSWKTIEKVNLVESKSYKLDTAETTLTWTGKYVSDGHTHNGTVKVTKGDLSIGANNLATGNFVVDMKTIDCTDIPAEKKAYLMGHLNSADFFDTEKFSEVKVSVTGMNDKEIMASIGVLGKEIKTTIPVQVSKTDKTMVAKGKFEVDFASLNLNGFKASAGKPENQRTDSKIAFDINLVLKN